MILDIHHISQIIKALRDLQGNIYLFILKIKFHRKYLLNVANTVVPNSVVKAVIDIR